MLDMAESKAPDIVKNIVRELTKTNLYYELKAAVQNEVDKPSVYSGEIKKHLRKFFRDSGYNVKLYNAVFKYLSQLQNQEAHGLLDKKEPLDYVKKAQATWERCIIKSINSMCTELALPLARKRSIESRAAFADQFNSLTIASTYDEEAATKLRPVYSSADFFETLIKVKNPNSQFCRKPSSSWGLTQVQLGAKSLERLEKDFPQLNGKYRQCGIDDHLPKDGFAQEHYKLGKRVILSNHSAAARQFCKQGCPAGLRKELWKIMLGVTVDDSRIMHFDQLKNYVFDYELLVDHLLMKDVRLTTANSDSFFVFEDLLNQILLVFSRDTWLLKHFSFSSASPAKSYIRGKLGVPEFAVNYPPSGIIPFHGFAMYAAPLCFIFDEPVGLYYIFRELYTRYFFRLHNISSHYQGILSLSVLFEKLLQSEEPILFKQLIDIEAQPLRMAFNWILFAFSGYLETDETLQLWDRILAFNTLELLPVLAVAIFSYRKNNLMAVSSAEDVEAILADITTIKVMPLLALFFKRKKFVK